MNDLTASERIEKQLVNSIAENILKDDSASYWLKDNIRLALGINTGITETKRDLIDLMNDVQVFGEVLKSIYRLKGYSALYGEQLDRALELERISEKND